MSATNKVVWSEGLFLQPQHLQQQDRYFERYVENALPCADRRTAGVSPSWRSNATFSASASSGCAAPPACFPDGTPFRMPDDEPLPRPIDIGADVRDQIVYLALPLRRSGEVEVDRAAASDGLERHVVREVPGARRDVGRAGDTARGRSGARCRHAAAPGDDVTDAYACVPLAHIVECRADQQVVLDDSFIPTVLYAARRVAAGDVDDRAARVGASARRSARRAGCRDGPGVGGRVRRLPDAAGHQPLRAAAGALRRQRSRCTPSSSTARCVALAGELATFTTVAEAAAEVPGLPSRPPARIVRTGHRGAARRARAPCSSRPPSPSRSSRRSSASASPWSPIASLYDEAVFMLAARADVPTEELRRRFPTQLKIGPVEKIRDLVTLAVAGVPVRAAAGRAAPDSVSRRLRLLRAGPAQRPVGVS